jgi:hypothetical protein
MDYLQDLIPTHELVEIWVTKMNSVNLNPKPHTLNTVLHYYYNEP